MNAFLFSPLSVCVLNKNWAACKRPEFASECDFSVGIKNIYITNVPWVLLYQC